MKSLLERLRMRRLASTFTILGALSAGILIGSVAVHGVHGDEAAVDSSDATPLKDSQSRESVDHLYPDCERGGAGGGEYQYRDTAPGRSRWGTGENAFIKANLLWARMAAAMTTRTETRAKARGKVRTRTFRTSSTAFSDRVQVGGRGPGRSGTRVPRLRVYSRSPRIYPHQQPRG